MRIIYNIISLIIAILSISCSKDHSEFIETSNNILFSVFNISTRAGNDDVDILKNSENGFGVFVSSGELQASGNYIANHQMKWNGSSWYDHTELEGSTPMLFPDNNQPINAYTYYPYRECSNPTNMSISVSQNQNISENIENSDLVVAQYLSASQENNPIPLTFVHQFNKFIFHFKDLDGTIINASIKSKITGKYNLKSQQVTSVSTMSQTIKGYIYNNSVEVINIPQSYSIGHELLQITVQKGETTSEHVFKLSKELISTQANKFIFNVNINPSSPENILPEPSNILPWKEKDAGDFIGNGIFAGLNTIKVSEFTDTLTSNGYGGGSYGFVLTPTEYPFFPYGAGIDVSIRNEQGESVQTRGGSIYTGEVSEFLKVDGNGELCQLKLYNFRNPDYVDTLDINERGCHQTFTLSKTEVFVPNIVTVTVAYNTVSKQITFTTDKPAPMDLIYNMYQSLGNAPGQTNNITVTIPTGQSSHSVDISSYDTSKNALITINYEKIYSRSNYMKDGCFIVLSGNFWVGAGDSYRDARSLAVFLQ